MSRRSKEIVLKEQPWFREGFSREQADAYLAKTPPGAFILRPNPAKDSYILDVQAGVRVGHVLLAEVQLEGAIYCRLPGTLHLFQSLYDLVLFCHYNSFTFKNIDNGSVSISLSVAMTKRAEQINKVCGKNEVMQDDRGHFVSRGKKGVCFPPTLNGCYFSW